MINLYPHQQKALDATKNKLHVAYYLDMGLGKTYVGSEKMVEFGCLANLLVCQKSKINDWMQHFGNNYPDMLVYDLTDKHQLAEYLDTIPTASYWGIKQVVGIINYELLFRRNELLALREFTLMLDESSLIQNESAKRSKFVLKLQPEHVILLSGTPTDGKYEKLWTQCKLLGWEIKKSTFYSHYVIEEHILDPKSGFRYPIVVGYKNVDRLKSKLAEHGAIFMKTEEVMELPAQQDIILNVPRSADYKRFMKNRYAVVDDIELIGDTTLTKRMYARQLCGHFNKDKLNTFRDLLDSTSDRLIVFYNFNAELSELETICKKYERPISYVNGKDRNLDNYETQSNSVTLIQYQAGAMGINLQKANKIVYFTLPERSELFEQSRKRIHRIGQELPCFYYFLLCEHSVEHDILKALKMRKDYTDALFEKCE